MPLYEYRRQTCGHVFEAIARQTASQKEMECPRCNSRNTKVAVTSPALIRAEDACHASGRRCCGRTERCENPPCSSQHSGASQTRG